MSPWDERCEAAFSLRLWKIGRDNFTACLFGLIAKADPSNRMRIGKGFPLEVEIFEEWQGSRTEKEFFEKYGVTS
jgi:hypothetical protein